MKRLRKKSILDAQSLNGCAENWVVPPGLTPDTASQSGAEKNVSELASAPALLANSISCTGADTCKLGICLSKGALRAISTGLTESALDLDQIPEFKLHLSGCPNTCGQHMLADLGFYGQVGRKNQRMFAAYGVVAGAVVSVGESRLARSIGRVSARDLPRFVCEVLKIWTQKKSRFHSFAAYVDAEGAEDIKNICERYRNIPDFEEDSSYFFDWGASELTLSGGSDRNYLRTARFPL